MQPTEIIAKVLLLACAIGLLGGAGFFNTKTQKGQGGTDVTTDLRKCAKPIGVAALEDHPWAGYSYYGLKSPIPLVKVMMQKSNCFRIVNRGRGSQQLKRERALADSGELQKGSNMGKGQMVAADFIIVPQVVHKDANAGGSAAGLGGLLPGRLGAAAGALRFKNREAQVVMSMTNVRTSIEEAIVEGSARKKDLKFAGFGWIGVGAGAVGGYQDTDIGKLVAAALMDAHNKLVDEIQNMDDDASSTDNAGWVIAANIDFYAGPSTSAPSLGTLYKDTSIVATGNQNGSWWEIEAIGKTGWVHSDYVTR